MIQPLSKPLLASAALGLALAACTTTQQAALSGSPYPVRMATAEDCDVISMALELFPRPFDGSPLRVADLAYPITPPFRPQRPEQAGPEALSLSSCRAIQTIFVSDDARVVLSRPEIHEASVYVRYREGSHAPVVAELERTPEGYWRHIRAFPTLD